MSTEQRENLGAAVQEGRPVTALGAASRRPIAVVGATGLQGGATVRALPANALVRALARRGDSGISRPQALARRSPDLGDASANPVCTPDSVRSDWHYMKRVKRS